MRLLLGALHVRVLQCKLMMMVGEHLRTAFAAKHDTAWVGLGAATEQTQ